MNTKRGALREGCSAFSAARAAATSGRSCSAACRVFFERDLLTIVEAPDRTRSNIELLRATEPQADVIKRQVRLRGDKIEQPLLMLVQRRAAMAGAGLGLDAAGRRPRSIRRIAVEAPTLSRRAPSRALSPSSTIETTRTRRSFEYPFAIAPPTVV